MQDVLFWFFVVYMTIGLVYALYVWLFAGTSFFAIPVNALLGPAYIVGTFFKFKNYRKKDFHFLFEGKKAVIFDLDGTIIDSEPYWCKALDAVKNEFGLKIDSDLYLRGIGTRATWEHAVETNNLQGLDIDMLTAKTHAKFLEFYKNPEAKDGFWELCEYLKQKGFKLGLASNSNRTEVNEIIRRLGAESLFDATIAGDEVNKKKPDPEMYRRISKMLGLSVKDIVVFEDSLAGVGGAINAGADTVVIWDEEIEMKDFPREVYMFVNDFTGLAEDIELSPREKIEKAIKIAEEQR